MHGPYGSLKVGGSIVRCCGSTSDSASDSAIDGSLLQAFIRPYYEQSILVNNSTTSYARRRELGAQLAVLAAQALHLAGQPLQLSGQLHLRCRSDSESDPGGNFIWMFYSTNY